MMNELFVVFLVFIITRSDIQNDIIILSRNHSKMRLINLALPFS